jgi:hypothetical protein
MGMNEELTTEHVATEEQVQAATDELLQQQQSIEPDKAASMVFKYYWPQYKLATSKLSNKDAKRLNQAIIGYPLEVIETNFYSKDAKEAFSLAKVLLDARFILQQKALSDKLNETETVNEEGNK